MSCKEQVRELSRKYLEEEISEVDFFKQLMRIIYVSQDKELIKWMSEQFLIVR